MAISTRTTSGRSAPAIIENHEQERVFGLFRQFGYLEAELTPLGQRLVHHYRAIEAKAQAAGADELAELAAAARNP